MAKSHPPSSASSPPSTGHDSRILDILGKSTEPIILLNRRRRLIYANRAWSDVTGISLDAFDDAPFKSSKTSTESSPVWNNILAAPDEVNAGRVVQRIRLIPAELFPDEKALPQWWELTYVPLAADKELAGVIVRIHPISAAGVYEDPPLPENIVNLRESFVEQFSLDSVPSREPAMRRVRQQTQLALSTNAPLMIIGEKGVGKQWLARVIHTQGAHPEGFFINIDCRRLPAGAVGAIVFGQQGLIRRVRPCTLHLRDPDMLPRELQNRFANDGLLWNDDDSQLRVTSSMRTDPNEAIADGRLLEDLCCLISPLLVNLPPLRDRRNDIAFYAERMLPRANRAADASVNEISPEAVETLQTHDWPGNLTELFHALISACKRESSDVLTAASLPFYVRDDEPPPPREIPLDTLLEKVERRLIELALRETSNKKQAAELLAIWRPRLLRRIAALGLDKE